VADRPLSGISSWIEKTTVRKRNKWQDYCEDDPADVAMNMKRTKMGITEEENGKVSIEIVEDEHEDDSKQTQPDETKEESDEEIADKEDLSLGMDIETLRLKLVNI
ncbi:unnamed protein product, partial [Gongylonema pulchrum]|uniref:DUF3381 domain-containing protein n=1 Tax=Gongylonema pulchrum TaxID=637853 RepID=A0A183EXF2_9BILA